MIALMVALIVSGGGSEGTGSDIPNTAAEAPHDADDPDDNGDPSDTADPGEVRDDGTFPGSPSEEGGTDPDDATAEPVGDTIDVSGDSA